jgi:UPF0716 family protein affecting phage T7 exclusion
MLTLADVLGVTWWTILVFAAGLAIGAILLNPALKWVLSKMPWSK